MRASFGPKTFEMDDQSSHVLLSACGTKEKVVGKCRCSVFTLALLSLLQEKGVGKLTYTDIVTDASIVPEQTPRSKRSHKSRYLFSSNEVSKLQCPIRASSDPDTLASTFWRLVLGGAHEIINGAQFHVYTERTMASKLINVTSCFRRWHAIIPRGYGLQTGGGEKQGC